MYKYLPGCTARNMKKNKMMCSSMFVHFSTLVGQNQAQLSPRLHIEFGEFLIELNPDDQDAVFIPKLFRVSPSL